MNGLSVLGLKVDQNLQPEIEFKSEFKNCKFHLPFLSVRPDQTFP